MFIQEDDLNSFPMNFSTGTYQFISIIYGTDEKQRVSVEKAEKKPGERTDINELKQKLVLSA